MLPLAPIAALLLAQPCVPPPLDVWPTRCGFGLNHAEMYYWEHLLPGGYVWSGNIPTTCQLWSGNSCVESRFYFSLAPQWECNGDHLFDLHVTGEPCPDRLNPQNREFFHLVNWWFNPGDIDLNNLVDLDDIWTLNQLVSFNDPKGDWNADSITNSTDLLDYLNGVWYGSRTYNCDCP